MTAGDAHLTPLRYAIGICLCVAALACIFRGIWLDEGYTLWFTGHDLSMSAAADKRWFHDGHPALYYAYAYLLAPLFGDSIRGFRFINAGALVVAAASWTLPTIRRKARDFAVVFAALTVSSPFFLLYAAELRSYFFIYVLTASLLVQLTALSLAEAEREPDRRIALFVAPTAILLINLHYVASLVGFIILGVEAVDCILLRRWRSATLLIATGIVSAIGLCVSLYLFLSRTAPISVNYSTALQGMVMIGEVLAAGLATSVAALVFLGRTFWTGPRRLDRGATKMVLVLMLVFLCYAVYNAVFHNLTTRFLIGAIPVACAAIAHAVGPPPRRAAIWIALNALMLATGTLVYASAWNRRWETNVDRILALRAECPASAVVALNMSSFLPADAPLLQTDGLKQSMDLTYRAIADHYRFPVEVAGFGSRHGRPGTSCPTILWVEHKYLADAAAPAALAAKAGFAGPLRIEAIQNDQARALFLIRATPASIAPAIRTK